MQRPKTAFPLLLIVVLAYLPSIAAAQLGLPPRPTNLAPSPYIQQGTVSGPVGLNADFRWRAGVGTQANPAPQFFAICLHPAPPVGAASCTWQTKRWSVFATGGFGLTRTPAYVPGTLIYSAYDYRFDPPTDLEEAGQDIPLVWSVASCIVNAGSVSGYSCNAASLQSAHFPASNLVAADFSYDRPVGTYLNIDVRATTPGSRAIAGSRFDVRVDAWEALTETVPPNNVVRCRSDYLAADIQANPLAFVVVHINGTVYYPNQLPAGTQATDIAGIHRAGTWAGSSTSSATNPPIDIAAGVVSPRGVYVAQITPNTQGRGFIVRNTLDINNRLFEIQETDNARARCKAF